MNKEPIWCGFRGLLNTAKQCIAFDELKKMTSEESDRYCSNCLKGQIANELQCIADSLNKISKGL